MQQPCSSCGYISDRPARFCRQCGSQLYAETESSSAETRNYGRQTPPQYVEQPPQYVPYVPGQAFNDQTPNTSPFYTPPAVPQYQYPAVEQKSSSWGKWILISLLTFLCIIIFSVVGMFYLGKRWVENNIDLATGNRPVVVEVPPIPDAPPAPDAPAAVDQIGSLDSFKYPGASIIESKIEPIARTISMTTDDDPETVKEYYDQKFKETFKNSPTAIDSKDGNHYTYASLSNPMLTIEIQPDEQNPGKTHISISRVEVRIPPINIPRINIPKIKIERQ